MLRLRKRMCPRDTEDIIFDRYSGPLDKNF